MAAPAPAFRHLRWVEDLCARASGLPHPRVPRSTPRRPRPLADKSGSQRGSPGAGVTVRPQRHRRDTRARAPKSEPTPGRGSRPGGTRRPPPAGATKREAPEGRRCPGASDARGEGGGREEGGEEEGGKQDEAGGEGEAEEAGGEPGSRERGAGAGGGGQGEREGGRGRQKGEEQRRQGPPWAEPSRIKRDPRQLRT